MIPRLIRNAVFAASALVCSAQAQQPAPQAPTAMPTIPPATCVKPEYPQKFADQRRLDRFNKEIKTYTDCVKKYIDDMKALADAAIDASKIVIDEYNALTADYNSRRDAK